MYTWGEEINWKEIDLKIQKIDWLISDVQLVKRNQLCNEEYFSGLINHRLCTWGEEINFEMRNIFLAWLISDVHLGRVNQLKRNWLKNTKNCLAWLISDVLLVKRNQLWNEEYFSGLINLICALGEKKLTLKWEIFSWPVWSQLCTWKKKLYL